MSEQTSHEPNMHDLADAHPTPLHQLQHAIITASDILREQPGILDAYIKQFPDTQLKLDLLHEYIDTACDYLTDAVTDETMNDPMLNPQRRLKTTGEIKDYLDRLLAQQPDDLISEIDTLVQRIDVR